MAEMADFDFDVLEVVSQYRKLPKTLPASIIMEMTSRDLLTLAVAVDAEDYRRIGSAIARRIREEARMRSETGGSS